MNILVQIEKLETQLAQKEVELQKVGSELKKHLSTDTIGGCYAASAIWLMIVIFVYLQKIILIAASRR